MSRRKQSFLGGAAVLMTSAFVVKVIGALFKIPLAAVLGGEGMGYYMTAYSFFNPVFALSAAGFPIAVSRLVSAAAAQRRFGDRQRILSVALLVFSSAGVMLWAAVYLLSPHILGAAENLPALKAVRCMAPAVFFCCVTSAFRGYYEGGRDMLPTAASQVAEAAVKLILGLFLAKRCVSRALLEFEAQGTVFETVVLDRTQAMLAISPHAAAAAVSGVAFSTAAGSLVMLAFRFFEKRDSGGKSCTLTRLKTARVLIKTALPVCLGAVVINLSAPVDLFSVIRGINIAAKRDWYSFYASCPDAMAGILDKSRAANFLYGSYTGLAMTVFNLVPALTSAIGICALPMVSEAAAKNDISLLRKRTGAVIKLTALVSFPMGIGMSVLAEPILGVLFSANPLETAAAARLMPPLGIAALFVALTGTANSVLQAMGLLLSPVKLLLLGTAIKLTVNLLLIPVPSVNILGAPIATLCCYAVTAVGSIALIGKKTGEGMRLFVPMLKPLFAALICSAAAKCCYLRLESGFSTAFSLTAAILCAAAVYSAAVVISGGITADELIFLKKEAKMQKTPL